MNRGFFLIISAFLSQLMFVSAFAQVKDLKTISVNLQSRTFLNRLPFDQPFFIKGTVPKGVKELTVSYNAYPLSNYDLEQIKKLKLDSKKTTGLTQHLRSNYSDLFPSITNINHRNLKKQEEAISELRALLETETLYSSNAYLVEIQEEIDKMVLKKVRSHERVRKLHEIKLLKAKHATIGNELKKELNLRVLEAFFNTDIRMEVIFPYTQVWKRKSAESNEFTVKAGALRPNVNYLFEFSYSTKTKMPDLTNKQTAVNVILDQMNSNSHMTTITTVLRKILNGNVTLSSAASTNGKRPLLPHLKGFEQLSAEDVATILQSRLAPPTDIKLILDGKLKFEGKNLVAATSIDENTLRILLRFFWFIGNGEFKNDSNRLLLAGQQTDLKSLQTKIEELILAMQNKETEHFSIFIEDYAPVSLTSYLRQDLGYAFSLDSDSQHFYTGFNVHFAPTNGDVSFRAPANLDHFWNAYKKRLSLLAGVSVNDVKEEGDKRALILDGQVFLGASVRDPFGPALKGRWRFLEGVRFNYGALVFRTPKGSSKDPEMKTLTVTETEVKQGDQITQTSTATVTAPKEAKASLKIDAEQFVSVTVDFDFKAALGKVGSLFSF